MNSFSDCTDAIRSYWSRAVLFLRHIRHIFISFHAYVCRLLSSTAKQQFTNMQITLKQDQGRKWLACFFFLFCSFFYYLVFLVITFFMVNEKPLKGLMANTIFLDFLIVSLNGEGV